MPEFHLDSRLTLVSQDSRLCVQDQFFLDPNLHGMDTLLTNVIGSSQDSRLCVQGQFSRDSNLDGVDTPLSNITGSSHDSRHFVQEQFFLDSRLHEVDTSPPSTDLAVVKGLNSVVNFTIPFSSPVPLYSFCDPSSFVQLHNLVRAAGVSNFRGARLPVPTSLNIALWRSLLRDYPDAVVCDFLEFGWPIGFDYGTCGLMPSNDFRNHSGALDFPSAVDNYLSSEIKLGSVCGPYARNPFSGDVALSPLNSVPKPDSDERRFILDLSWPSSSSVNDGISKHFYLGEPVTLRYPTVDDIADRIVRLGTGCLLFKRDLKRAYRQLPVDPFDYPLLGYSWRDNLYFDVRLPMGLRSAAMACQRVTNAVCFMLSQVGCQVLSYLDDFMGISPPSTALEHFVLSGTLLRDLGLQESPHKACSPSTQMTCLGVLFDTVNFTMSVTPDRLRELQEELLPQWLRKHSATKRELQSLIGKLAFVCKCVRPGRLFLCRLLDTLRSLQRNHHRIKLSAEFRKDIHWWIRFISVYNGVSLIPTQTWSAPDSIFSTDACLTGCGGMTTDEYFHVSFPSEVLSRFSAIHLLEALVIVVALRLWGRHWRGQRIVVYCDNFSVVSSLNSGRVQDKLLASCLREIWFLAAVHEFELRACHLSSSENRGADLLSRWHLKSSFRDEFLSQYGYGSLREVSVPADLFQLSDSI